jgi:hypothetical protein
MVAVASNHRKATVQQDHSQEVQVVVAIVPLLVHDLVELVETDKHVINLLSIARTIA